MTQLKLCEITDIIMKITFLLSTYGSGGAERTVAYLSEYFAEKGHQVDIVVTDGNVFYPNSDKVNIVQGNIQTENTDIISRIKAVYKRYSFVRKYMKQNKPDIVFCVLTDPIKYLFGLKKCFKLITSERNNPSHSLTKKEFLLRKICMKYADSIVFQTERAQKLYSRKIQAKSVIIPNAIGNELVYEVPEIIERKKKLSAMGRLSRQKDYPTLIKAFKIVNEKYPDYTLEIFGKGKLENQLKNYVQELNLADKVIFAGVTPDAILKIADSECFVLSSRYEGMPNALMEAMAIGLPCVSTDCPNGPAELIENEVNGLLVPVGDENALAYAILRYIEDKDFARMCGQNASKIKESHSMEKNAKRFLEYFEAVVKE